MTISDCCSSPIWGKDLCSSCWEHTQPVEAECECGEALTAEQMKCDMQCDRCSYLATKC